MDNEEKPVPAESTNDFGDLKELIHKYLSDGVSPEKLVDAIKGCLDVKDEDEERAEGEKAFGIKFVD